MTAGRTFRVREAGPADARAIAGIHVETWRTTYAGILADDYLLRMTVTGQSRQWSAILRGTGGGSRVFVAVGDDAPAGEVGGGGRERILGFASCGPARRGPVPHGTRRAGEVYTLYVEPDRQGEGAGRALLHACFDALRGAGRRSVLVWVLAANPARFFYEAMGGRRMAEQTERFGGRDLPEIAYGWDLGRL